MNTGAGRRIRIGTLAPYHDCRPGAGAVLITDAVPSPVFANHESFHLRYGWLKKAHDGAAGDPQIFNSEDATVRLGVGKNMVRSIRFWAAAAKVIETSGKGPSAAAGPTEIGTRIFGDGGLDPYLERPETGWLVHWLLLGPPCRMPVWWMILNDFSAANLKADEVSEQVSARLAAMPEWNTPSPKSVRKDVDVFMHTYGSMQGRMSAEDYLNCPLRELRLVVRGPRGTARLVDGIKHGMSPHIMAFVCLDFVRRSGAAGGSISVARLATEAGAIGSTFRIGEADLAGLLSEAARESRMFDVEKSNGSHLLTFRDAGAAADGALLQAYGQVARVRRAQRGRKR